MIIPGLIWKYTKNILVAIDQTFNALMGGSCRETISSRLGKLSDKGNIFACRFCGLLDFLLGPQHCHNAEIPDDGREITGPYAVWFELFGLIITASLLVAVWAWGEGLIVLDWGR